jgi:hypothetical protein
LFEHYGHGCAYCGSKDNLQFDHVNGDGSLLRKQSKSVSYALNKWYKSLIDDNFPSTCQVLCRQCNIAKQNMSDAEFKEWILFLAKKFHSI